MGKFAIGRPVTITIITIFYVALGFFAYWGLTRDLFPRLTQPTLKVVARYEGAAAPDIEELVTKKLEEQLAGIKGIKRIVSYSGSDASEVLLEFDITTDLDFAAIEVREKLDQIQTTLPSEVERPVIERTDPSNQPALIVNVTVGAGFQESLRQWVEKKLQADIERISGVAAVKISGGRRPEILVQLDRDKLRNYKISPADVEKAFQRENINLRGGRVSDARSEFLVRTVGKFATIEDIKNLMIPRTEGSVPLYNIVGYARDSAGKLLVEATGAPRLAIMLQSQKEENLARLRASGMNNSQACVQIAVFKKPGSSIVSVCAAIRDIIARHEKSPDSALGPMRMVVTYDQSVYIDAALANITQSALYGIVLTVLILFLFLRNIASTIVVAVSMPIAVIAAFALFPLVDVGLNLFSMAGLTLAVGMVVDNAIVVIEAVFANLPTQKKLDRAIMYSLTEVGPPVWSSTLTTLVVFIPLLFVPGFIGQIFRDLSYSIIFSLIFSLVVAFTFIPMLLYKLSGSAPKESNRLDKFFDRVLSWSFGWLGKATLNVYSLVIHKTLQKSTTRLLVICVGCVLFLLSLRLVPSVELLPDIGENQIQVKVVHPSILSLAERDRIARSIEKYLEVPQIQHFTTTVSSQTTEFFIMMPQPNPEFISSLRSKIASIPDIRHFSVETISPIKTVFGQEGKDIAVRVAGPDLSVIDKLCLDIVKVLQSDRKLAPYLTDIQTSMGENTLEWLVHIDKNKTADLQMFTDEIAQNVALAIGGKKVSEMNASDGTLLPIHLVLAEQDLDQDTLLNLPVKNSQGQTFSLKTVTLTGKLEENYGLATIMREERQRVGFVYANIRNRESMALGTITEMLDNTTQTGICNTIINWLRVMVGFRSTQDKPQKTGILNTMPCPPGYQISLVGRSEAMQSSISAIFYALIAAVILVYMVIASLFESLLHPLAIMFSIPLAGIGALWALWLCNLPLSTPALIGLVMLAGIVVNNAIILIDYVNILRGRGHDRNDAIVMAGLARMRPIFMTTLTTVLGMIPIVVSSGAQNDLYRPLAIVVMAGLSVSTVLTLVFIPTFYCFLDDIVELWDFMVFKVSLWLGTVNK